MHSTPTDTAFWHGGNVFVRLEMARGRLSGLEFVSQAEPTPALKPEMAAVCQQLSEYFAGSRKIFAVKLQVEGTEFQKAVWNALLQIPYGETRSYKDIAMAIGRPQAFRAVGQAIHRNPIGIIIPCHRVVGTNGALTGFAGGIELKKRLLDHEAKVARKQ